MITVRVILEWVDQAEDDMHPHTSRDLYEVITDQPYSPDVADDLVRRVMAAVKDDRQDRLNRGGGGG